MFQQNTFDSQFYGYKPLPHVLDVLDVLDVRAACLCMCEIEKGHSFRHHIVAKRIHSMDIYTRVKKKRRKKRNDQFRIPHRHATQKV